MSTVCHRKGTVGYILGFQICWTQSLQPNSMSGLFNARCPGLLLDLVTCGCSSSSPATYCFSPLIQEENPTVVGVPPLQDVWTPAGGIHVAVEG